MQIHYWISVSSSGLNFALIFRYYTNGFETVGIVDGRLRIFRRARVWVTFNWEILFMLLLPAGVRIFAERVHQMHETTSPAGAHVNGCMVEWSSIKRWTPANSNTSHWPIIIIRKVNGGGGGDGGGSGGSDAAAAATAAALNVHEQNARLRGHYIAFRLRACSVISWDDITLVFFVGLKYGIRYFVCVCLMP